MQGILASLVILGDGDTRRIIDAGTERERVVLDWRLTLNVGGVSFDLSQTHATDAAEAAEVFAARVRGALRAAQLTGLGDSNG
jgi:hypothetical protein